jgi:heat shock protein HslJ
MRWPLALGFALSLGACAVAPPPAAPDEPPSAPAPAAPLAGTRWQLVELQAPGERPLRIPPANPPRYTLHFEAQDQVAMRLDCNRGRGGFAATPTAGDRGSLRFGPIAMTRMLCPRGSQETRVARELAEVRGYALAGADLRLELATEGAQQVWRRVAP